MLANLWDGTDRARDEARSFAELIATAVGARVFSLRVRGHEKNCILLAVKRADGDAPRPSAGKADARTLEALRLRLRAAASEHAAAQTEAALVESMRGNAATLEVWAHVIRCCKY